MRQELTKRYHELQTRRQELRRSCGATHPDILSIDAQLVSVCQQLDRNPVQPKDEWERLHGVWLNVPMPDDGYLPGELLKINNSTTVATAEGTARAVICERIGGSGRYVVLLIVHGKLQGATQVTPGPLLL